MPAIVLVYYTYMCCINTDFYKLSKKGAEYLRRIIYVYGLYEKYEFYSHNQLLYISALCAYGILIYNDGEVEQAKKYLESALEQYEKYKMLPIYKETTELLVDVCNVHYTLSMYYADNDEKEMSLRHVGIAQSIYKNNPKVREYFGDINVRNLLENKNISVEV